MTINWNKVTCEELPDNLVVPVESWTITLGRTGETMTIRQYMDRINQEFMAQFVVDAKYPPW